jgi:hypothetical protein
MDGNPLPELVSTVGVTGVMTNGFVAVGFVVAAPI